jgi:hypothetical protein
MTSLAFMFVWVPLPVCQTLSGKWSSSRPSMTSSAAAMIRRARSLIYFAQPADDRPRHLLLADGEVDQGAGRLRPPVAVGRDRDGAHAVGLLARGGAGRCTLSLHRL